MIHLDLFLAFLKIGLFTFGGGYAMLPMIQEEVAAHGWLNQSDELVDEEFCMGYASRGIIKTKKQRDHGMPRQKASHLPRT